MPKRKRPIDNTERMAHREAGRAVIATYYRIPFVHFGLSMTFPTRPVSRYSRLHEYCRLSPGKPADRPRLEKYVSFLLSGSLCDMLYIERCRRLRPHGRAQGRFRKAWYEMAWDEPDHLLDLAYQALVAWAPEKSPSVEQECQRLWDQTCQQLENPPLWHAVEDLAQRMIWEGEIVEANDVLELIAPSE